MPEWRSDQGIDRTRAQQATFLRRRGIAPRDPQMAGDPAIEALVGGPTEPCKGLEVDRQRDAREPRVAREDVRQLVIRERELHGVDRWTQPVEVPDVAVIQRPRRLLASLDCGVDPARDGRAASVGPDDQPGTDLAGRAGLSNRQPGDSIAIPDGRQRLRSLEDLDAGGGSGPIDQELIEHYPTNRQPVAKLAPDSCGPLMDGSASSAPKSNWCVRGGAPRARTFSRSPKADQHRAEPRAAEEVGRYRVAWKRRGVDDQNAVSGLSKQRPEHGPGHASTDDCDIDGVSFDHDPSMPGPLPDKRRLTG